MSGGARSDVRALSRWAGLGWAAGSACGPCVGWCVRFGPACAEECDAGRDEYQPERGGGADGGVGPVEALVCGHGAHDRGRDACGAVAVAGADVPARRAACRGGGGDVYGAVAVAGADVPARRAACGGAGGDVYGAVAVAGADVPARRAACRGGGGDVYGAVAVAGADVPAQGAARRSAGGCVCGRRLGVRGRRGVAPGRGRRARGGGEREAQGRRRWW